MAWGSKTQIITSASVTDTESFSSAVTLEPYERAEVEIEADFPASPTDTLLVAFYATLDDSSENWDDTPFFIDEINFEDFWGNSLDPNKKSYTIFNKYKFKVGVKASGSTDTITVNSYYRKAA